MDFDPGGSDMLESAWAVYIQMEHLLQSTGSDPIDVIAHSQSAGVVRWVLTHIDGAAAKVRTVISLGGVEFGIRRSSGRPFIDLTSAVACGVANKPPVCDDVFMGSPFFNDLGNWTPASTNYYHLLGHEDARTTGQVLPGALTVDVSVMCTRDIAHINEWTDPVMRKVMEAALKGEVFGTALCSAT